MAITNEGIRAFDKSGLPGSLCRHLSDAFPALPPPCEQTPLWPPITCQPACTYIYSVADPEVHYDAFSFRYWAVAYEKGFLNSPTANRFYFNVAVSQSPNPNGDWNRFRIDMFEQTGDQTDAPSMAVDETKLYLCMNRTGPTGFDLVVLDKAPLLVSQGSPPPEPLIMNPDPEYRFAQSARFTALAVKYGPADGTPQYMIADTWTPAGTFADQVELYAIQPGPPIAVQSITLDVPGYFKPSPAPQRGSIVAIRTHALGMWSSVYRNGTLWAVECVAGYSETIPPSIVRWYEIAMNGWGTPTGEPPALLNSGNIMLPGVLYASYPSIAVDNLGNAVITFNGCGRYQVEEPNNYLSIWRAVRCNGQSTFGAPELVEGGDAVYETEVSLQTGISGWSDYSGTEPDFSASARVYSHNQIPRREPGTPNEPKTNNYDTWVSRHDVCTLDVNGDGDTTMADYLEFLGFFSQGSGRADYRSDGVVDTVDVSAFTQDFFAP